MNDTTKAAGFAALLCATILVPNTWALAQSTAPLFSTPASRSTTGAPILSDPTTDQNGIIPSTGGGTRSAPKPAETEAPAQAAKPADDKVKAATDSAWEMSCETVAGNRMCQISASTITGDKSQVILVMSLAPAATKGIAMQMAVPLGIAVQDKVELTIEDAYRTDLSVDRCTQQGCLIEETVEPGMIAAMKEKAKAQVIVTTPEGNKVPIDLSLSGFSKALEAMEKQVGATQ
ncbi:invasion associated locus B family protein [Rhizobium halophytocola]|uniref:Invasion protein IalB n=1 Tax=Rhizobium halophytocola TaxID=735519 RepID=A0ABS4DUS0_9HYPH|nr:invasion associated locus B family protein [Rhizobium halophytocola]MBP1849441.1 invasion protein IalB [Rhizobium halophytocola]